MFKSITTGKIINIVIIVYTILNFYAIGKFIFTPYWSLGILQLNGGMVIFSIVISMFLNATLVICTLLMRHKYENNKK